MNATSWKRLRPRTFQTLNKNNKNKTNNKTSHIEINDWSPFSVAKQVEFYMMNTEYQIAFHSKLSSWLSCSCVLITMFRRRRRSCGKGFILMGYSKKENKKKLTLIMKINFLLGTYNLFVIKWLLSFTVCQHFSATKIIINFMNVFLFNGHFDYKPLVTLIDSSFDIFKTFNL